MSLFRELKRRNVFKVAMAYLVSAWLFVQIADVVLNNVAAPDWVFTFLMVLLALGLLFSVIFAWAFELTPEGIKREREVDRSRSITAQTGQKLNSLIIGILVVALAYFVFDKFSEPVEAPRVVSDSPVSLEEDDSPATTEDVSADRQPADSANAGEATPETSIAVLPFVNMSSDPEQEFFSDGLSEELLNLLAKIPELSVAARTSSFSLKGKELQISEIGNLLKVNHVLEGSVRRSGNKVRITAQLIKADDGYHVWSETYDRELNDIFAIQDEIAANVVGQLKIRLLGTAPSSSETTPEAYELYLHAKQLLHQFTVESLERSIAMFRRVIELDKEYAPAWAGLGRAMTRLLGTGMMSIETGVAEAKDAYRRAIEIDPNDAEYWVGLAWIAGTYDADQVEATRLYEKAWSLDPHDPSVLNGIGVTLFNLGRPEEALPFMEAVVQSDPLSDVVTANLSNLYMFMERYESGVVAAQRAVELNPGGFGNYAKLALNHMMMENWDLSLKFIEREPFDLWRLVGESMIYDSMGDRAKADGSAASMIEQFSSEAAYNISWIYARRGDSDSAFEWLEKEYELNGKSSFSDINVDAFLKNLWTDPRWQPFLEKVGQSPTELDKIKLDVTPP